ncbi:MAG: outer membrane beta-barrel protein [Acidobacteria bacterium]|nr:outer membrane beta-barrel protein [Acidobacteriota bacterium]
MARWATALVVAAVAFGVSAASAQETTGAATWEITGFPGGGILFTEGSDNTGEPDFGNYALGGSLTYNINQYWGIEGEFGAGLGIDQRINFNDGRASIGDVSPPDMIAYNANALFYPFKNDRRFVPYVTGGAGGLTMFQEDEVGFDDDETFFTGNAGGGVKWYFGNWGVRGDYRFIAIKSKDDAPAFFANADTRYGHRVYGGLVFGFGR